MPTPPDAESLREAALAYLARFAATKARLTSVLDRRIGRWQRAAAEHTDLDRAETARIADGARLAARQVVARLVETGAVDDAAFAAARARRLARMGRSRQAVRAHLAARGVEPAMAEAALPDDPARELAAALTVARRRRLGPFRAAPGADAVDRAEIERRELGVLARAGFSGEIARRALGVDRDQAERLVAALRGA